ncbi:MAG: aquaporin family protein [Bacteroidetes bacterium]|nr:aquaporin family protein [Bacteroidota bacterium]
MTPFIAELVGTCLILILGEGVVANAILAKTKGNGGGLIAITFGWAIAVFVGVFSTSSISGAHLNPAVTIGLAMAGNFDWALVPTYILAQLLGAMLGSTLVWIHYRQHLDETPDPAAQLACFATGPAIKNNFQNIYSEVLGTFILVFAVLFMTKATNSLGPLDALPVALVVLGIGLSLGGTTGYAINPARDLGPRIMHTILPIKGKGSSDWGYSWIPVVGPIIGAVLAAVIFKALH